MALKGTESKQNIFSKLIEIYPGSFWEDENKILRIPLDENGERVEIKVTLTAAKANLGNGMATSAFSEKPSMETAPINIEMTEEEKDNVSKLLNSLGL